MLRRFSVDFTIFAMVLEAVLIALSLAVATHFRPALSSLSSVAHIPPPLETPFVLFPIFSLLWVIIFPLLGLVALAIRFNSPGPVLLHQKRVGKTDAFSRCSSFARWSRMPTNCVAW